MAKKVRREDIVVKMEKLEGFSSTWRSKARRNLRMFEWSPNLSIENMTDESCVGYYQMQGGENDDTSSIQENVIRSAIDTLVSNIASRKVHSFINTVNGSYKDMQAAKQAQDYFDAVYEEQNINKTITDAFKDACIFDRGVIYIDRADKRIQRVIPWQIYVDPREASYGRLTQLAWKRNQFPVTLLPLKTKDDDPETVTYWQYWDLNAKKKYYYIPELDVFEEETWECDTLPFIILNYASPIKAISCSSVVDQLYGIQMEIWDLLNKIRDASQLSTPLKFFVPEGSTIKANKLSNRTGEVITYTATPNMTGSPVTVATEPFMDPQWMETVEILKNHAYEIVGVSQLDAAAKKPAGLNSGVAISTYEDIADARFEVQLNNVIRTYTDIAKLMCQVFDPSEDILPESKMRSKITWADIVEMRDNFSIQFSAADALGKDPATKYQLLQNMYANGDIPQYRKIQLMNIPDLQAAYNIGTNAINAVLVTIDNCLENDEMEIPDYIPNAILLEEIMNTILSLKAANKPENEADIAKLMQLYQNAQMKNIDAQTSAEMAATQSLTSELQADMQNPNGAINSAMNQAGNMISQDMAQTNKIEGDVPENE